MKKNNIVLILKSKAEELSQFKSFTPTKYWIHGFLKRHENQQF